MTRSPDYLKNNRRNRVVLKRIYSLAYVTIGNLHASILKRLRFDAV